MENLDHALFLWLNAPAHPSTPTLLTADFLAEWLIWAIPICIGLGWLRGDVWVRKALLIATVSGLVGLILNQLIALIWPHPRPFVIGLGHRFVPHVADSSFPSDHLTLWWSVAFSVWMQPVGRRAGAAMTIVGLAMAWARVYVGVHFPLDMVGALMVASVSAWFSQRTAALYLPSAHNWVAGTHRILFGPLIKRGWVRG